MRYAPCTLVAALLLAACAASPYDFPTPTLIGTEPGYAMTGYMATDSEAEVRARLEKRIDCPAGVDIVSLVTTRADNRLGAHILKYDAIMKCRK